MIFDHSGGQVIGAQTLELASLIGEKKQFLRGRIKSLGSQADGALMRGQVFYLLPGGIEQVDIAIGSGIGPVQRNPPLVAADGAKVESFLVPVIKMRA